MRIQMIASNFLKKQKKWVQIYIRIFGDSSKYLPYILKIFLAATVNLKFEFCFHSKIQAHASESNPHLKFSKKDQSEVQFIKIKFVFLMLSMSNVYQDEQCWDYTKLAWICHHWYTRKPWIIKSAPFIDTRISFWAALSSFITPRIERCL